MSAPPADGTAAKPPLGTVASGEPALEGARPASKTGSRAPRLSAAWLLAAAFFWLARPGAYSLAAGGAVVLAGLVLRAWAAGVLEKDWQLTVSGPYAFTRNPLYLGSFVVGVGAAVAGGVPWFALLFVAFFGFAYGRTMAAESRDLEARFGERHAQYRNAVPLFLPRCRPYRHPARSMIAPDLAEGREPAGTSGRAATSFSLRRYARNKEYEAALGAAAGFGVLAAKAVGWWG